MRRSMPFFLASSVALILGLAASVDAPAADRPHLLLITADDLNQDSLGCFGSAVAGTTPALDRLAREGVRFRHAHVNIAVCQPCRGVIMTGRYPHRSGGEGFHRLTRPGLPVLPALLREGGYAVGILGKVGHSTPYADFQWDLARDQRDLGEGRSAGRYARYARQFFEEAKEFARPCFLMVNTHDPHRPFAGGKQESGWGEERRSSYPNPSRVYRPEDVVVPGFLPDLPEVRREIAEYYGSVRRCDDVVAAVLAELEAAGLADDTVVIFLSDHGMALPFAKTNCYLHSTRTPLIVRGPGMTDPGRIDETHFVSTIDLLPTLLEFAGLPAPPGVDGRSFAPLLRGEDQEGRDRAYTQFFQTSGRKRYPMRAVQTANYGYIFNAWADGERVFRNESQSGRSFAAMRRAAGWGEGAADDASAEGEADPALAARVRLFLHREVEELFDVAADPDSLVNLAASDRPAVRRALDGLRADLEAWMRRTGDPLLPAFAARDDPAALAAIMELDEPSGPPPTRRRGRSGRDESARGSDARRR